MTGQSRWLPRTAGAVVGLTLAAVLLVVCRPGAAGSPLPAAVRVAMAPAGELEVSPPAPRPLLVADSLRPGGPRAGADFRIRNQTGVALALRLGAEPDSTALDGLLRVRLLAGGRVLADTTLEGLGLHPAVFDLRSGEGQGLHLEAWIPRGVLSGYEGRLVHVTLVPRTAVARGGR